MPSARRLTPTKLLAIAVLLGALIWYALQVLKPPLPVNVRFRSETQGPGFALIFQNQSDRELSFSATLQHPDPHQERTFPIRLAPHGSYTLGRSQGWTGQSGDRIGLSSRDFREWKGGIP